jgi:hypothetical protein
MNIVLVSGSGAGEIEERLLRSRLPITSLTCIRPFLASDVHVADLWIVPVTSDPRDIDQCQETVAQLQNLGISSDQIMVVKTTK